MLYRILRPVARIVIGIFFRKIHIAHRERIPAEGPILIASNHPNSFAEPCITACYQRRELHFLVRGDVFKKPALAWLLKYTNQIPIYRFKDGYSDLRRNDDTFERCYEHLRSGRAIMIFSEGGSVFEKRLRPLKKGTARMAFGALEKYGGELDLKIVPLGVNYTHGDRMRSEVMASFGEPIDVRPFYEEYKMQPQLAVARLTALVEARLRPEVVDLPTDFPDRMYDEAMDMMDGLQPSGFLPVVIASDARLRREQRLAAALVTADEPVRMVWQAELSEIALVMRRQGSSLRDLHLLRGISAGGVLSAIILLPVAILGWLLNLPALLLANLLSAKVKKAIEFYTPVRMGSLLVLSLIFQLTLLAVTLSAGWYLVALLAVTAPLTGWISVYVGEQLSALGRFFSLRRIPLTLRRDLLDRASRLMRTWQAGS